MNEVDYKIFTTIARMPQNSLFKSIKNFLKKYYPVEKIIARSDYILCEGEVPIMLVAHLDTVFKTPPQNIYYDQKQKVFWSPQGLGADDRAGVFAIMKIIQNGYRPHICFTTDEEKGGIGAKTLIKEFSKNPFPIKYIVELDRQGFDDCVFYSCGNQDFQNFIEKYKFQTEWGTFSDISIICPTWGIAGVNLSIGYFNEHNFIETLHTNFMYSTIKKVQKMIKEIDKAPNFKYIYISLSQDPYWKHLYCQYLAQEICEDYDYGWDMKTYHCEKCKQPFLEDDLFLVKGKDGTKKYYCINCVNPNVNWCSNCGEPFETDDINSLEDYCMDCKKNKKESLSSGI
jgi:hypothetical protein